MSTETPEVTLEHALDEMHGWNRILSGYQGQEVGYKAAIAALRRASGVAFENGDDGDANSLRAHAKLLEGLDVVAKLREQAEEAYQKQEHWRKVAERLASDVAQAA